MDVEFVDGPRTAKSGSSLLGPLDGVFPSAAGAKLLRQQRGVVTGEAVRNDETRAQGCVADADGLGNMLRRQDGRHERLPGLQKQIYELLCLVQGGELVDDKQRGVDGIAPRERA
jgi:hypothetical protein